jgi:NAD+ synthase (glutamine-hydrolysing)
MENFGFVRVAAGIPTVKVADPQYNAQQLLGLIQKSFKQGVRVLAFPELSVTGYTCGDLFLKPSLLRAAEEALSFLLKETRLTDIIFIVGMPVKHDSFLFNAAVVCYKGKILGIVPKTHLPNYKEFYEKRWFTSALEWDGAWIQFCGQSVYAGTDVIFQAGGMKFGVEICEDVWAVIPPSCESTLQGAEVIFNLSASNALVGKHTYVRHLIAQQSARTISGYIYVSCGKGESTTDVVYGTNALIYENGKLLAASERFAGEEQLVISEIDTERLSNERTQNSVFRSDSALSSAAAYAVIESGQKVVPVKKLTRTVDPLPFVPQGLTLAENCGEIFAIQREGLATRLEAAHAKTAVVGISGGLDSTLALLVCVQAFDVLGWSRKNIIGITMPGFGTTDRTYQNAITLMKKLGITVREISIKKACEQHFADIGHSSSVHDITYENAQARERTQILMDVANQTGGLVVGTGDLSELALGWATYNGDHMAMYGVNSGVPKTLVRSLVLFAAAAQQDEKVRSVLEDITNTPISPELLPADKNGKIAQKTEETVGPYELHDFFLYYFLRYGFGPAKILFLAKQAFSGKFTESVIKKWLTVFFKRFFAQQFKRSCLPDGPKVGSVNLSPRGDWRMPSDASYAAFLKELE